MAYCAYCGSHVAQVSFVPCASCGHPTNGAPPRPVVSGGGSNALPIIIGVVAGFLVLIAIIGILAAIAIPNLLTATQRSRQKRTMADLRTVGTALDAYAVDHAREPLPDGEYVEQLREHLQPTYVKDLPSLDGWGTGLRYRRVGENGYALVSPAADGKYEQESPEAYTSAGTQNFDCDIVYMNGGFVQYPEYLESGGSD